jgi:hypothetical protein
MRVAVDVPDVAIFVFLEIGVLALADVQRSGSGISSAS